MRQIAVELTQDTDGDGVIDQWGVGGMFFTAFKSPQVPDFWWRSGQRCQTEHL